MLTEQQLKVIEGIAKNAIPAGETEAITINAISELISEVKMSRKLLNQIDFDIFDAISRERAYQDGKWGPIEDNPHTIPEWVMIMEKELHEAKMAFFQRPADDLMLVEILQVISVGVACLQQHGVVEREQTHIF